MVDLPAALPWPLTGPGAEDLRTRLWAAYDDPARGYHDTLHLREVLARIDELLDAEPAASGHRDVVVLAAWFHDAVYPAGADAHVTDPEEESAAWAERALPGLGVDAATAQEVARLVRLTVDHRPAPGDVAGAVLSDADMAILASGPQRYAAYCDGVRRDFAAVPDDLFAAGRSAVLQGMLDAPALFHTAHGRAHWETPARANITAELDRLGA